MQTTALLHYTHGVQSASKLSSITTFTTLTGKENLNHYSFTNSY